MNTETTNQGRTEMRDRSQVDVVGTNGQFDVIVFSPDVEEIYLSGKPFKTMKAARRFGCVYALRTWNCANPIINIDIVGA